MSEKRNRGPNFVESDKYLLVKLIMKYKHIIESKHIDGNSIKAKKACWDSVESAFNNMSFHHRSVESLKYLWDNMKHDIKRIRNKQLQANFTGGGMQSMPELCESLQLTKSIMDSCTEVPEKCSIKVPELEFTFQDAASYGSNEDLDESKYHFVFEPKDKHETNSEKFSSASSPSPSYQASTPSPLPSSFTGPSPAKRIAIENVSGYNSPNAGKDITSCIEAPHFVAETLHKPSLIDPVDACMQFLASMLKEFRSEEMRLETMNEIVKAVIQAKTLDLQQARKT